MTGAVLITGANRGIGRAMLDRYAARGPVVGTARSPQPDTPGVRWEPFDATRPEAASSLASCLDGLPLNLLVCNAGIFVDRHEALDDGFEAALWADTFATNVTGVFLTVQALLPNLARGTRPRIAIISSQMGSSQRTGGGSYIYRASKAAVTNLGRNLATDLAPRGIAVGMYHPGWVRTDMGGAGASISVDDSADGLVARFDALSLDTTGCFETWDGQAHPF